MTFEGGVLTRDQARAAYAGEAPIPEQAQTSEVTTAAVR